MKKVLVLLCIVLMVSCLLAEMKKGLLISSYSADYEWDKDYSSAMVNDLKGIVTLDMFYLNTKKSQKKNFHQKLMRLGVNSVLPNMILSYWEMITL